MIQFYERQRLIKQNPCRFLLLAGLLLSFITLNPMLVFGADARIVDVSTVLNSSYDLIWTLSPTTNKRIVFSLFVETPVKESGGYRLTLTSRQASWQSLSRPAAFPPVISLIMLAGGQDTTWTLKRRAETVALLCNHRLVFSAPAPSNVGGLLRLAPAVRGVRVSDMHYQPVEAPRFGDDFMRSGGIERMLAGLDCWQEAPLLLQAKQSMEKKEIPKAIDSLKVLLEKYPTTEAAMEGTVIWYRIALDERVQEWLTKAG